MMELTFSEIQPSLEGRLAEVDDMTFAGFTHLVKADISGIQSFIFNVQSDQAAKTLKGRSFFIHSLGVLVEHLLTQPLADEEYLTLFNGGGNVYLFCKKELDLLAARQLINEDLAREQIYLHLGQVEIREDEGFGDSRKRLEEQMQLHKYQAFAGYGAAFTAFDRPKTTFPWASWTSSFVRNKQGGFSLNSKPGPFAVAKDKLTAFNTSLQLDADQAQFAGSIANKLPLWSKELLQQEENMPIIDKLVEDNEKEAIFPGQIIEFEALADFAYQRTRTKKLGVLKMDVDNLGILFGSLQEQAESKKMSNAMSWFYDELFYELWSKGRFPYRTKDAATGAVVLREADYQNNLYIVFAGGDDCFIVGGWDAVFHFARRVREEFRAFVSHMQKQLPKLPDTITISGGLAVVNPKFPALQFAKIAENELDAAKHWSGKVKDKDRISVFGEALTWAEFEEAYQLADQLSEKIMERQLNRAILERIKKSAIGYEKLQARASDGQLKGPKVWRLFHFLGKRKGQKNETQQALDQIIRRYANNLMKAYIEKKGTSHMVFPIAARWAEFMTANR